MSQKEILTVNNLKTSFMTDDGEVPAVNDISFHVNEGEVLGIVGESGSGKSVTSLSIMGLISNSNGKITGEIKYRSEDLTKTPEKRMRKIRGNEISMIFQEPMTSLNPLFTIGNQLTETVKLHYKLSKKTRIQQSVEMLKLVGLPRAEEIMNDYPHQLSGGMRQRVMIAMAMICNPNVLIADEPTTALDVTIQSQVLKLMKDLNKTTKTAIMLITHDLGVVAEMCDRVIVMYSGKIVEEGDVKSIFKHPKHPYTAGLIQSVPDMRKRTDKLFSIPGNVPEPGSIEVGCRFASRCEHVFGRCTKESPELYHVEKQNVRCFLYDQEEKRNQKDEHAVNKSRTFT